jgi:hypothetical protein
MRSKLEIIQLKVDKFNEEREELDTRISRLRWRRKQEVERVFRKFFTPDTEGIRISSLSERRIELALLDDKYGSIIIERINLDDIERGSWSDELVDFKAWSNGVTLKNVEELEKRAELQIKFAQQFSDFKDDAIAEVNHVQEKYNKWVEGLHEEQSKLRELSRPFSKELSELKEEHLMNQLMEGVELKMSEPTRWSKGRFPELQVKFDWTLRDVKKVKVNRLTASGKSADIEVIQEWKDWDGNVHTATQSIERVRLDNIKSIVRI